jgi:hypothetical protein
MKNLHTSAVSFLLLAGAVSACGSASSDSAGVSDNAGAAAPAPSPPSNSPSSPTSTDAQRAIAEADIIQLDGGILFAMSKSGTLSAVDVSSPAHLALIGQTTLPGEPFEMYLRGNVLLAMSNGARGTTGEVLTQPGTTDSGAGAALVAIDISVPSQMRTIAVFPVPGEVADSRIVGSVLYLATYENALCFGCGAKPRTMVTSFDVQDPMSVRMVDQLSFQSNAPDQYNLPWGSAWKRSILATTQRLYVGGHADIDPNNFYTGYGSTTAAVAEGIVDVVDITDPTGRLAAGAHLQVAGAILSRWQFDEQPGVFRVISQTGAGRTGNGVAMPEVETFTINSTQSIVPLGRTTLQLPRQEGLRTVRFDTTRAYAITYNQTDPLFAIDLSDPSLPLQRGQLSMPGFMYYLEPHGDRVIGLGVDRADPGGSLNVSLFDVSNLDAPTMLARVPFGTALLGEDYQILNYELPEDQDRIQKAFRVFPDGLVAVPFSATNSAYSYASSSCANMASGVQIVQWVGNPSAPAPGDSLTKRALLPIAGNPRRAFENQGEMLTVSDSNVRSFSLAQLGQYDTAAATADLVIGTCVADVLPNETGYGANPGAVGGGGYYYYGGGDGGARFGACTVGAAGTSGGAAGSAFLAFGCALLAFARRRR